MKGKNNRGGAAQPKTGNHYTPICRASGYDKTMGAMDGRTRSGHQHSSTHYQYESAMKDDAANVHGYHPE
jgi:hypothetical protein